MTDEEGPRSRGVPARAAALLAVAVAVAAAVARLTTVGEVFAGGAVRVPPLDDLYHARRILLAVESPAALSEPDPRRGVSGAFCPWPPGWDLSAALLARVLGLRGEAGVLSVVVFVPPLVGTLLAALGCFLAARRWGLVPGFVTGLLLALTPALLEVSSAGQVDHHFLEPPLLLAILAATVRLVRGDDAEGRAGAGLAFGLLVAAALLVQVSLLLAAGVAFAALLAAAPGPRALGAGALGFGAAGLAVSAYRLTRPAGYPDSQWFLGTPHAAALLAAALACAAAAALERSGRRRATARLLGAGLGGLALLAVPGCVVAFLEGARFLGGDPWLDQIAEFRPLLGPGAGSARDALLLLGGGALAALALLLPRFRGPGPARLVLAFFSLALLAAACARQRFAVQAAPFLAIAAGAVVAGAHAPSGPWRPAVWGVVALVPTLVGALPYLRQPRPIVSTFAAPLRVAGFLRGAPTPGRVLGPWYLGHAFDVLGGRGVLVDGFGTAPGRFAFESAHEALVSTDEERLVAFCRARGVRFLVLDNPLVHLPEAAREAGRPEEAYLVPPAGAGSVPRVTRLLQATVWWRAYFDRGSGRPERGRAGDRLRHLRLVYVDPEPAAEPPPYGGPALEVWEVVDVPVPRV